MRYATVCSGVEAMSLAVQGMGWKPVFFAEIEPFPCAILNHHYPNVPNLGDVTKIEGKKYHDTIDILAGGTPCQSFSVAGNRKGLGDERGALMFHFVRMAYEAGARWVLWENVPGVLSQDRGQAFAALLSCLTGRRIEVPKGGWRNAGAATGGDDTYGVAWRTLDAEYVRVDGYPFAVPQRRRRVWVIGHLGDWRRAAEVLLVGEGLSGDPPTRKSQRQDPPADAGGRAQTASAFGETGKGYWQAGVQAIRCEGENRPSRPSNVVVLPADARRYATTASGRDVFPTICGEAAARNFSGLQEVFRGKHLVLSGDNTRASVTKGMSPTVTRDNGAVPIVLCDEGGESMSVTDDITTTVTGNSAKSHAPIVCYENHPNDSRMTEFGDKSPTLTGRIGTGGGNLPLIQMERPAFAIAGNEIRDDDTNAPHGPGINEEVCFTIESTRVHGVCVPVNSMVLGKDIKDGDRQTTGIGEDGDPCPTLQAGHHHAVATDMFLRRLTPLEVERLMGFPDDYTRIPWTRRRRNEPTAEFLARLKTLGKDWKCHSPDSLRYRSCGNSWAVNCARWVCRRIETVDGIYKKLGGSRPG